MSRLHAEWADIGFPPSGSRIVRHCKGLNSYQFGGPITLIIEGKQKKPRNPNPQNRSSINAGKTSKREDCTCPLKPKLASLRLHSFKYTGIPNMVVWVIFFDLLSVLKIVGPHSGLTLESNYAPH